MEGETSKKRVKGKKSEITIAVSSDVYNMLRGINVKKHTRSLDDAVRWLIVNCSDVNALREIEEFVGTRIINDGGKVEQP